MSRPTTERGSTDPAAVVGPRIRELRRRRGLTLQELGARTNLTHAFLSQVERGLARPSLRSAVRIAAALGVAVGTLIEPSDASGGPRLTRATTVPGIGGDGVPAEATVRALTSEGHALQGTLSQGHLEQTPTLGHAGEELVHVIDGSLAMTVGDERFVLGRGDTLVFDGRSPHTYEGVGSEPPVFLVVVANADAELPRDGPWTARSVLELGDGPLP
jgi:mannose-6-phosphate isomerase-like protein (cupin superfamily)